MSTQQGFSHLDERGDARMVDVVDREVTVRTATATGRVRTSAEVVARLRDGTVPKGDVLSTARIAGIMGAKRTSDLIPMCHPLALHGVTLTAEIVEDGVELVATVRTADRTGVEMEALTAIAIAGLTVIDMVKALDPACVITDVCLQAKDGGRNGSWRRPSATDLT